MKRLLLLDYFFPPLGGGGCQRSLRLVRYLEPNGWASTVVTVQDPDYWIVDPTLLEEVPRSCDVRALRRLQQLVAIPDGYRPWARTAERAAAARVTKGGIDAIWTTFSPERAHLAGLGLKRKFGLPWVADFRDPRVGRVTYAPPTAWHDRRHRALEAEVVRAADPSLASLVRGRPATCFSAPGRVRCAFQGT